MYSAEIYEESQEPYKVIRTVPREAWSLEIKRFSNEVTRDIVALSGMKFFYLTRGMVLSVRFVEHGIVNFIKFHKILGCSFHCDIRNGLNAIP